MPRNRGARCANPAPPHRRVSLARTRFDPPQCSGLRYRLARLTRRFAASALIGLRPRALAPLTAPGRVGGRVLKNSSRRGAPTNGPPSPSACGAQIQAWPLHISAKARSVPWEPGRVVRFQPRRKVHFVSEVADGAVLRAYLKSQAAPQSYFRSNLSVQAFAQPPPARRAAARYIPLRGKTNAVPT